jgi:hypothetical protein
VGESFPVVYVRGFAGTQGAIDQAVNNPPPMIVRVTRPVSGRTRLTIMESGGAQVSRAGLSAGVVIGNRLIWLVIAISGEKVESGQPFHRNSRSWSAKR